MEIRERCGGEKKENKYVEERKKKKRGGVRWGRGEIIGKEKRILL